MGIFFKAAWLVLFSGISALLAQAIPQHVVENAAGHFIEQAFRPHGNRVLMKVRPAPSAIESLHDPKTGTILAHIVHMQPNGFVVFSNDRGIEPVIAYSFDGHFSPDTTSENHFYHMLIRDLSSRMQVLAETPHDVKKQNLEKWNRLDSGEDLYFSASGFQQWPAQGTTYTGGWVETMWDQNWPYNAYCPWDPITGQKSLVGCLATALAQVVHYHKWIGNLNFGAEDRYTTWTRHIQIDGDSANLELMSFYGLNGHLNDIRQTYANNVAFWEPEKAALSYACGVIVQMDYASDGSAAFMNNLAPSLIARFGYRTVEYRPNLNHKTGTDEFYCALQEDMMNGLPALLNVGNSSYGHAIVCDGYNTDDFFHLNFGWGGDPGSDWYSLPHPPFRGFDLVVAAIIHMRSPGNGLEEIYSSTQTVSFEACPIGQRSSVKSFALRNGGGATVTIHSIESTSPFLIGKTAEACSLSNFFANLAPGDSLNVFVACVPDHEGVIDGRILVLSSATNPYMNIHLMGYGSTATGTLVQGGPVSGNWTKDKSPYCVCGDIAVQGGKGILDGQYTRGGGIFIDSSSPFVAHSTIARNRAYEGGAVYCRAGNPRISFMRVENNSSSGTFYFENASAVIENTLFYGNKAPVFYGSFLITTQSNLVFNNVTVVDNQDGQANGGFIWATDGNRILFKNSIIWGDRANPVPNLNILLNQNNTLEFEYSDVQTTYLYQHWPVVGPDFVHNQITWGQDNIAADPLLTAANGYDCALQDDSPCIDAGNPDLLYDDAEDQGNPGFALVPAMGAKRNDMGAYGGGGQGDYARYEFPAGG
jgi:hypothetical protein